MYSSAGGRYKNMGLPVLLDPYWIEHFVKASLYSMWEILGEPEFDLFMKRNRYFSK